MHALLVYQGHYLLSTTTNLKTNIDKRIFKNTKTEDALNFRNVFEEIILNYWLKKYLQFLGLRSRHPPYL